MLAVALMLSWTAAQAPLVAPPEYRLPALTKRTAAPNSGQAAPLQVGEHRPLPAKAMKRGKWCRSESGKMVWRLRIASTAASAVRLHVTKFDAGAGRLRVHDGQHEWGSYTGKGPLGDGDFWTHIAESESVIVEYEPAGGVKQAKLPFQIAELSHQY